MSVYGNGMAMCVKTTENMGKQDRMKLMAKCISLWFSPQLHVIVTGRGYTVFIQLCFLEFILLLEYHEGHIYFQAFEYKNSICGCLTACSIIARFNCINQFFMVLSRIRTTVWACRIT